MGENESDFRDVMATLDAAPMPDLDTDPEPLPVAEEPKPFPWDDPKWQGHTHSWPELPEDDDAEVSCGECGLPMQVGLIRADQDGGPGD